MGRNGRGKSRFLEEDVLLAYDKCTLNGRFTFVSSMGPGVPLEGGLCGVLRGRSSYFNAMLNGLWSESCGSDTTHVVVNVLWPENLLSRLLRFLHGGGFLEEPKELPDALECAKFFGVPALANHISEWIVDNLTVESACAMWNYVHSEPMLRACSENENEEDLICVDETCFDFHIINFEALAAFQVHPGGEAQVLIHELHPTLMHRLLASGLVNMQADQLLEVVRKYARVHSENGRDQELYERMFNWLNPTSVLFNRDHRNALYWV